MKPSIGEIVRGILLLVIAVELAYIALQLPVGGGPVWPHEELLPLLGKSSYVEKIPKHTEARTIGETVAYTACAVETILKLQVASRDTMRAK